MCWWRFLARTIRLGIAVGCALTLLGCVPAFVTHPNIGDRAPRLKNITLLPPRIDVFEIGAGGVLEKMDDWSRSGAENVLKAFQSELGRRNGVQLNSLETATLPEELKVEIEQTQLLFDAVSASIALHIYGPELLRFDDKRTNFQYSLGVETAKLATTVADALLIVKGFDQISSSGRQAVQVGTIIAAAALGIVVIPQGGITAMNVALVDARSGDIVSLRSPGGHDLRNPSSASAFVKNILTGFPTH